jgi:hypothetical protein
MVSNLHKNNPVQQTQYATADDINSTKSTINKVDNSKQYVTNISDPNVLYDFASYTTLFTLSALSKKDLENTTTLLNGKPHDIIVRSAGIGANENQDRPEINAEIKKTIEQNDRLKGAIDKSRKVLSQNRDLYIKSVTMNSLPGLNEKRRLTSVVDITMEIIEPFGITLLERVRAAAINNNYLDHLDAPYLLTVDFKGFDEQGRVLSEKQAQTMRRVIPIKLIDMQMDVNQAGTVYTVKAIPYNEFAFVNTYSEVKTAGSLYPEGKTVADVVKALEDILNQGAEDDVTSGKVGIRDKYQISIHEDLNPEKPFSTETLEQTGMFKQNQQIGDAVDTGDVPVEYMKIKSGDNMIKILEEIMKGHPDFTEKKYKEFRQKASRELGKAQFTGGAQAVLEQAQEFYFKYFKIKSSVIPDDSGFDLKRATNPKIIKFTIEPYKVHAYSLSIPGVSTGKNFKNFVFKTYNYIFTGDNVDVLDLNINYRVAYFQGTLKDVQAENSRKNTVENVRGQRTGTTTAVDNFGDGNLLLKSEPTIFSSEGTGKTGGTPTELDAFLDTLTHPLADMVNIRMEILGDPAWLGQSQFIPVNPELFGTKRIHRDVDMDYWQGNRNRIWNDRLRCYNPDVAEPIILLNFRMPTDVNDRTGVYELQSNQSAEFSGLYRVIGVEHNFSDGKYTNVLQLTRFNNQGVVISNPVPTATVLSKDGTTSEVKTASEARALVTELQGVYKDVSNIGRKFTDLISKIKGFFG